MIFFIGCGKDFIWFIFYYNVVAFRVFGGFEFLSIFSRIVLIVFLFLVIGWVSYSLVFLVYWLVRLSGYIFF